MPSLIEFSEYYIDTIFAHHRDALILVSNDRVSTLNKVYAEAAAELNGSILFIITGTEERIQTQFAEFLGVDYDSAPALLLLSPNRDMGKFKYERSLDHLTVDSIQEFL